MADMCTVFVRIELSWLLYCKCLLPGIFLLQGTFTIAHIMYRGGDLCLAERFEG